MSPIRLFKSYNEFLKKEETLEHHAKIYDSTPSHDATLGEM